MRGQHISSDFQLQDYISAEIVSELRYKEAVAGLHELNELLGGIKNER